mmetsp:Transcript_11582/g.10085  ORF Transcript_11582/g.10085 Transcript_11582/m.10085 type:complete len:90 (+) Transcript_11582:1090-1359(+)
MYNATTNNHTIITTLSASLCSNMSKATINYDNTTGSVDIAGINYATQISTLVCGGTTYFETSVANYHYLVNSLRSYSNPVMLEPDCSGY